MLRGKTDDTKAICKQKKLKYYIICRMRTSEQSMGVGVPQE